jgi:hypothetical protein
MIDLLSKKTNSGDRFCRKTGTADLLSYTPVLGISIFGQIVISFKDRHHQQEIILQCVRWYVASIRSAIATWRN